MRFGVDIRLVKKRLDEDSNIIVWRLVGFFFVVLHGLWAIDLVNNGRFYVHMYVEDPRKMPTTNMKNNYAKNKTNKQTNKIYKNMIKIYIIYYNKNWCHLNFISLKNTHYLSHIWLNISWHQFHVCKVLAVRVTKHLNPKQNLIWHVKLSRYKVWDLMWSYFSWSNTCIREVYDKACTNNWTSKRHMLQWSWTTCSNCR